MLNLFAAGEPMRDERLRTAEPVGYLNLRHAGVGQEFFEGHLQPHITEGITPNAIPPVFVPAFRAIYRSAMRKPMATVDRVADAARLKAIWERRRTELGMTQEAFVEGMSFGQAFFNHLLHGRKPLNYERLIELAERLGVRPEEISPGLTARLSALVAGPQGEEKQATYEASTLRPEEIDLLLMFRTLPLWLKDDLLVMVDRWFRRHTDSSAKIETRLPSRGRVFRPETPAVPRKALLRPKKKRTS